MELEPPKFEVFLNNQCLEQRIIFQVLEYFYTQHCILRQISHIWIISSTDTDSVLPQFSNKQTKVCKK